MVPRDITKMLTDILQIADTKSLLELGNGLYKLFIKLF